MTRLAFMVGFKGQDRSEKPADAAKENLIGYFSCEKRVAVFLGIESLYAKSVKRTRASYTKNVLVNGVATDKVVEAGDVDYMPSTKARSRTVVLKTGAKAKKTNRTLSLTFPSTMSVAQIGEALAEYIPDGKIQPPTSSAAPAATEIYPQFTIKGGRTYPLMLKAAAETSTSVDAPATDAEQVTLAAKAK